MQNSESDISTISHSPDNASDESSEAQALSLDNVGYQVLFELIEEIKARVNGGDTTLTYDENVLIKDGEADPETVSQSLSTINFEIFKITEMARRWIVENGLSPYKLALITGTSPSQVHRIMEPGWKPSLKLARRIVASLPPEWVSNFERDCNSCLPRLFYLQPSPVTRSGPINYIVRLVRSDTAMDVLDNLLQNGFSFRRYQLLSRRKTSVFTALNENAGTRGTGYLPPPPRLVAVPETAEKETNGCTFSIHRAPMKNGDRINLFTIHIAEFEQNDTAFQFWKLETSKDVSDPRQLDILDAYLAELA